MRKVATHLICGFYLCVAASAQTEAKDKETFEKICGACHKSSMVHNFKSQSEWVETVDNMVTNGAEGTEEEFQSVMRYLARNLTKVNVNTASAEEIAPILDMSNGVAEALVFYRTQHGPFSSLDELKKVPGLDGAKLEARKQRVAFK